MQVLLNREIKQRLRVGDMHLPICAPQMGFLFLLFVDITHGNLITRDKRTQIPPNNCNKQLKNIRQHQKQHQKTKHLETRIDYYIWNGTRRLKICQSDRAFIKPTWHFSIPKIWAISLLKIPGRSHCSLAVWRSGWFLHKKSNLHFSTLLFD
jgi:hypothetical protein